MDLILPAVQDYASRYSDPEDELLKAIHEETVLNHREAHMISGHTQGIFLQMMSKIISPLQILEIGTFTGYSALCLAKGLQPNGILHTIELREEDAAVSRRNFNRSNLGDKIILHTGNALEIIPRLNFNWDLVFIDADKVNYINYYELVLPFVKSGGVILADNVLFHGQVLSEPVKGKSARAIQEFNEHVQKDERVEKLVLTIRDGLMLIRKK